MEEGGPGWVSSICLTPSRIETFGSPPLNTWFKFSNTVQPLQKRWRITSVQSSSKPVSSAKHLLIPLQKKEEKLLWWIILLQCPTHTAITTPVQKVDSQRFSNSLNVSKAREAQPLIKTQLPPGVSTEQKLQLATHSKNSPAKVFWRNSQFPSTLKQRAQTI